MSYKKILLIISILVLQMIICNMECSATIVGDNVEGYTNIGDNAVTAPPTQSAPVVEPEPAPAPAKKTKNTPKKETKKEEVVPEPTVEVEVVSENTISEPEKAESEPEEPVPDTPVEVISENTVSENSISKNAVPKSGNYEKEKQEPKEEKPEEKTGSNVVMTIVICYLVTMVVFVGIWIGVFAPFLYFRNEEGNYKLVVPLIMKRLPDGYLINIPERIFKRIDSTDYKIIFKTHFVNRHQGEYLELHVSDQVWDMNVNEYVIFTTQE